MWTDKLRSHRCSEEDTCVMDPQCPFIDTCRRVVQDTEPICRLNDDEVLERLARDLNKVRRLRRFRAWIRVGLSCLPKGERCLLPVLSGFPAGT
jgi:hypothetical protein